MKIDIPWEAVDACVVAGLKDQLDSFENYLRKNEETEDCAKVFDSDRLKDRKLIKKHIKACKRMLRWYGENIDG